jgi:hypothetical protein
VVADVVTDAVADAIADDVPARSHVWQGWSWGARPDRKRPLGHVDGRG